MPLDRSVTRLAGTWLHLAGFEIDHHMLVILADGRGSYTYRHDVGEAYVRLIRYVSFRWEVDGRRTVRLRGQRSYVAPDDHCHRVLRVDAAPVTITPGDILGHPTEWLWIPLRDGAPQEFFLFTRDPQACEADLGPPAGAPAATEWW